MDKSSSKSNELNVLVVGNNPTELTRTFESLKLIREHIVITEMAFDLRSIIDRLAHFKPNYILIDDNLGQVQLKQAVDVLLKNRRTKNIPITILKNSNYREAMNTGVMNYILKDSITGESLHTALKNSLKFKKTQLYLLQAYKRRKGQLLRVLTP